MVAPTDDAWKPGEGDSTHLTPTQENHIVAGMLGKHRRRWKLTPKVKAFAIRATLTNLEDEDPRVRNGAVANLIRMEGQNIIDEHKSLDKRVPDLHAVACAIDHRITAQELLTHPSYVEWLRNSEVDSEPRPICQNGHAGNGQPLDDGHTRNGH
jgi:hypothetical protein